LNPFWVQPITGFILVPDEQTTVGNPANKRFRELLVDERKKSGLTQHELASRLERPQSFVSKYERGDVFEAYCKPDWPSKPKTGFIKTLAFLGSSVQS
jgi:hypothetical protein